MWQAWRVQFCTQGCPIPIRPWEECRWPGFSIFFSGAIARLLFITTKYGSCLTRRALLQWGKLWRACQSRVCAENQYICVYVHLTLRSYIKHTHAIGSMAFYTRVLDSMPKRFNREKLLKRLHNIFMFNGLFQFIFSDNVFLWAV